MDQKIVKLLKERQEISIRIGKHKKREGYNVISGKEEDFVIDRTAGRAVALGLLAPYAQELSKLLIKYSKITQLENIFKKSAENVRKNVEEKSKKEPSGKN